VGLSVEYDAKKVYLEGDKWGERDRREREMRGLVRMRREVDKRWELRDGAGERGEGEGGREWGARERRGREA